MENHGRIVPKFTIDFIERAVPNDPSLPELIKWCGIFHKKDLAPLYEHGSYGNLSYRTKPGSDQFMITASALKLKEGLSNNNFVNVLSVDLEKHKILAKGSHLPSSETMLHHAIYNKRKDVNAIFHGHSPDILRRGSPLNIPTTRKEEPYGTIELANEVLSILADHKFIIMKGHGFISLGANMEEAGENALRVLSSC